MQVYIYIYIYIYKHTEIYICLFTDIKLTSVVHAPKKYTRTALGMFDMSVKGLYLHPETQKKTQRRDWFETRHVLLSWPFGTFQFLHLQTAHLIADVDQRRIVQILTGLTGNPDDIQTPEKLFGPPKCTENTSKNGVLDVEVKLGTGTLFSKTTT